MPDAAVAERLWTIEELEQLPDPLAFELADGVLEERAMGWESSTVAVELITYLRVFAREHNLGRVAGPDLGLRIWPGRPGNFRRADGSFTSRARIDPGIRQSGFLTIAPDLVIEVVSRWDNATTVNLKTADYLQAGVRLVWVVYPATREVEVYRLDGSTSMVRGDEPLDGEDVVPGFSLPASAIFVDD